MYPSEIRLSMLENYRKYLEERRKRDKLFYKIMREKAKRHND